jgi:hypothetical protein
MPPSSTSELNCDVYDESLNAAITSARGMFSHPWRRSGDRALGVGKVERRIPVKVCSPTSVPLQRRVTIFHELLTFAPLAQASGAILSPKRSSHTSKTSLAPLWRPQGYRQSRARVLWRRGACRSSTRSIAHRQSRLSCAGRRDKGMRANAAFKAVPPFTRSPLEGHQRLLGGMGRCL